MTEQQSTTHICQCQLLSLQSAASCYVRLRVSWLCLQFRQMLLNFSRF